MFLGHYLDFYLLSERIWPWWTQDKVGSLKVSIEIGMSTWKKLLMEVLMESLTRSFMIEYSRRESFMFWPFSWTVLTPIPGSGSILCTLMAWVIVNPMKFPPHGTYHQLPEQELLWNVFWVRRGLIVLSQQKPLWQNPLSPQDVFDSLPNNQNSQGWAGKALWIFYCLALIEASDKNRLYKKI